MLYSKVITWIGSDLLLRLNPLSIHNVVLLAFMLTLALPLNVIAQIDGEYVTFGKSIYGVSIKHPIDWEVKEGFDRTVRDDQVGFDLIASMCPKSILEDPDEYYGLCPDINEVTLATSNLPKNTTMEEYIAYIESTVKFGRTDYQRENLSDITVAGLPAKKLLYSYFGEYQGQDEFIRALEIFAFSGHRTYEIKYQSPQLQFDDLLPTVERMIDSLKILPIPPCNFVRDENVTSFSHGGKCVLKP